MSVTITLVSARTGTLSSMEGAAPAQVGQSVDVVLEAPWADGQSTLHIIPFTAVADVQMTFGFTEQLDAVDHIIRTVVAEHLDHPAGPDDHAAWQERSTARVAKKMDLWRATHRFGLQEAKLTPLTTHAQMYRTIFSIVAPPDPGGDAQAAAEAKAVQDAQKAALDDHRAFYQDCVIDTASQGWKDLQDIFGTSARTAAEDDPRAGNFLVRYGSAVHKAIGDRLRAEGLPVDPPVQPGV